MAVTTRKTPIKYRRGKTPTMNVPPVFLVLIFGASLFAALVIFAAIYSGRDDQ